jgi:hypothetical protein
VDGSTQLPDSMCDLYHYVKSIRFLEIDEYYNVGWFRIFAVFQTSAPNLYQNLAIKPEL